MVSIPLALTDSIIRSFSDTQPRRPLRRHPAQTLVIPLMLCAAMLSAPVDPAAAVALVGASAALLVMKWPAEGTACWRLEAGIAGHLALAVLVSSWWAFEIGTALASLSGHATRVLLAGAGAAAILFSTLELVTKQGGVRRLCPEAVEPLQPFFNAVADSLQSLAALSSRDPEQADAVERALRRAQANRHHLANLSIVARSRPFPEGVGPVVATLWELLDPLTLPFPVERVRVHRDIGPGELMAGVPSPYLEHLFWNLADNAFRACAENAGGGVSVCARATESGIEVSFADDGAGVPESERAQAFLPLRTSRGGRLHLGLAASRKVAEAYGGSLELVDRPGGGTLVTVTLPSAR